MATLDIKYDFNPTDQDGTPGEKFERFEIDAMNAASKADKRGFTIAETWLGTDEGGVAAGAPALPINPAAIVVEATNARRARLKNAYHDPPRALYRTARGSVPQPDQAAGHT